MQTPLIYIIEDSTSYRILLNKFFSDHAYCIREKRPLYQIKSFASAREAYKAFLNNQADYLIVDYNLDEDLKQFEEMGGFSNGFDLYKKIKMLKPSIKCVFLSQINDVELTKEMYSSGVDAFFSKNILGKTKAHQYIYQSIVSQNTLMVNKNTYRSEAFQF